MWCSTKQIYQSPTQILLYKTLRLRPWVEKALQTINTNYLAHMWKTTDNNNCTDSNYYTVANLLEGFVYCGIGAGAQSLRQNEVFQLWDDRSKPSAGRHAPTTGRIHRVVPFTIIGIHPRLKLWCNNYIITKCEHAVREVQWNAVTRSQFERRWVLHHRHSTWIILLQLGLCFSVFLAYEVWGGQTYVGR